MRGFFCLVAAKPDTFAAVDAARGMDHGVTVTNADRFGRTPLQTGGAALAFRHVEGDRMLVFLIWQGIHLRICFVRRNPDKKREGKRSGK